MNKNNYSIYAQYVYFIYFLFLLLVIYQLLFCNIVYCDGSINSTTNFIEIVNLTDQDQISYNEEINVNCSTVFTRYQDIARRRFY
jgi:hypothetical protein